MYICINQFQRNFHGKEINNTHQKNEEMYFLWYIYGYCCLSYVQYIDLQWWVTSQGDISARVMKVKPKFIILIKVY